MSRTWHNKDNYYCGECGSRAPKKPIYLWWPVRIKWVSRKMKRGQSRKLFSAWGCQVGYAEHGRYVIQRIVRIWRFLFVFGSDYKGHEYDRERQVWLHPDMVKYRDRGLEPYKEFVEKMLSKEGGE
mgnify:CR=1 FL=1